MSSTVFLGNLPTWVTADDVKQWLVSDNLVADSVKVIRNPETQESKGFAFIEAPNDEEMNLIIRRFDRAPLEERLLRANPAQPPRPKGAATRPMGAAPTSAGLGAPPAGAGPSTGAPVLADRNRRGGKKHRKASNGPQSAFAEELAKAL
ncbi:MAG TPA: RNA-binding protein [Paludibaculum sp.]|jgi:RNA recognition motif-containing protein